MRRTLALIVLVVLTGGLVGNAAAAEPDEVVVFDAQRAHVYARGADAPLLRAGGATATDLAKAFLRAQGKSEATVDSLKVEAEYAHRGITYLRLRQEFGGLRVAGAYVRAALDARGDLVHVIENIVDVPAGVVAGRATAEEALAAALAKVHPGLAERPAVAARAGNVTTFRRTAFFQAAPRAERVILARASGALEEAFLVETWSRAGNLLHQTLVDRGGRAVASQLRTANDSYKIFPEDPGKTTTQITAAGPGAGNAQSPAGWLTGPQTSIHITGNNVSSYLDVDANNAPDTGGTTITSGDFLASANLSQAPTDANNQAVSVQNLFYLNNVLHDTLYRHGFTEATGNFQEDNFLLGGAASDSVNAEAQDGSGTDNANFATPTDGQNPRMQMFLWTGAGPTHEVLAGGTSYGARDAQFGPALTTTGVTGPILAVNDGVAATGGTTTDGCERLPRRSLAGAIALVDRGLCTFTVKVKNAQAAGAVGVIVANNDGTDPFVMGGSGGGIRISAVMISQASGTTLRTALPITGTIRRLTAQALQIDSALDSDIVYHEYGHGLTWRMIGSMSGPMSGAIGEGASDALSMLINGDDRIAEYSASDALGIRRAPYTNYPNTYTDWTGAEVHDDGEIYAAIIWRLIETYPGGGFTIDHLFATWVGGMNFTPAGPAVEDMRDGMLESAAAAAEDCLIWNAFAAFGVGVGADGTVVGRSVRITESTAVPAGC